MVFIFGTRELVFLYFNWKTWKQFSYRGAHILRWIFYWRSEIELRCTSFPKQSSSSPFQRAQIHIRAPNRFGTGYEWTEPRQILILPKWGIHHPETIKANAQNVLLKSHNIPLSKSSYSSSPDDCREMLRLILLYHHKIIFLFATHDWIFRHLHTAVEMRERQINYRWKILQPCRHKFSEKFLH